MALSSLSPCGTPHKDTAASTADNVPKPLHEFLAWRRDAKCWGHQGSPEPRLALIALGRSPVTIATAKASHGACPAALCELGTSTAGSFHKDTLPQLINQAHAKEPVLLLCHLQQPSQQPRHHPRQSRQQPCSPGEGALVRSSPTTHSNGASPLSSLAQASGVQAWVPVTPSKLRVVHAHCSPRSPRAMCLGAQDRAGWHQLCSGKGQVPRAAEPQHCLLRCLGAHLALQVVSSTQLALPAHLFPRKVLQLLCSSIPRGSLS